MTTEFTKAQLAIILSALDDQPRSPANRQAALKAIAKSAERYGLTAEDILGVAPGLLDGRLSPADFRAELAELADRPEPAESGRDAALEAQEPAPVEEGATAEEPAPGAGNGAAVAVPSAQAAEAAPEAATPMVRAGTKQALMIDLLKRPEGATIEQIAAATGWQRHSIRGAMSGALKKKLGLTIEATRTREVGPNRTGTKGSSTVYRIVG